MVGREEKRRGGRGGRRSYSDASSTRWPPTPGNRVFISIIWLRQARNLASGSFEPSLSNVSIL
jgi:hypothetical protein